ncbi:MAG: DeoR/GlpR family DNA-binding transcription regulator [Cellulomonas sp.]|uniref:DeoR/GlpR family DNA-binding transcription regulator n=1 Tax=Cellulomonas sp. TaxID=40001 RepID=UPI0025894887|nr:DeoR/GlpR family DNA-binding transcription regulator [Cellulomonas sp.]MCR6648160.1 DeoR/GlpR family DNA-binding transcription regulator [Cellulomonas sp.]MCR6704093.1 DeoR/GlpR family DNA-binding transcription regulator [Cellulomonas sp.]
MLATQRQELILAAVREHGAARVSDLVGELGVSDMTIRRDIAELARAGLVRRVHGGAVAPEGTRASDEPGFDVKVEHSGPQKAAIAHAAHADLEPGQTVALSAGSTTYRLAELIAQDAGLRPFTVVTNGLRIADALHRAVAPHGLEVVLTGGVRTPSDALVGRVADASLGLLRVDRAFLGVHGLDESGLTTPNLAEAATDRALMGCAAATTVLADHTKWGVVGLAKIADLDEVDLVVMDDEAPAAARRLLTDRLQTVAAASSPDDTAPDATTPDDTAPDDTAAPGNTADLRPATQEHPA